MDKQSDKYDILRQLVVAGSRGEGLSGASETALRQASELVGLTAGALYLWDREGNVEITVTHASTESGKDRLKSLEDELFSSLRREKHLVSAYMSFGGSNPCHSFTLPLRHGERIFGAVIGLQEGERTIVSEDLFLEALSSLLALNYAAVGVSESIPGSKEDLEKEKLAGIVETAVTVNHEINSPLTAILGNIQLLLRNPDNLNEEVAAKLKTIEISAERIREVTHRLLRVTSPRSVEYADGIKMLDISDEEES